MPKVVQAETASEVAQVLARIVPALPRDTADDLRQLLAHDLSAPLTGERRESRLGLLIDMISSGSGEVPSVDDYESRRALSSDDWPAASTLLRSYRTWLNAVRAAMKIYFDGSGARVPVTLQHARWSPAYSRDEIIDAISRCKADIDAWPTASEYQEWAKIAREIARRTGRPDPRLPVMKPIRRYFGTFDAAIKATKRTRS